MIINVFNASCDLGVDIDGSSEAPLKIKGRIKNNKYINSFIEHPCNNKNKSHDKNDLRKNIDDILDYTTILYKSITSNKDSFNITIGGDHCVAVASSLASVKNNDVEGIIWIDSHADYNTFDTTITGNIHGLPLASINGLNKDLSVFHNGKYIDPKKTVIIGYRSEETNKADEENNLKNAGVTVYTTKDLLKKGIKETVKEAISIASNNNKNKIHLSFDIDFIDPKDAPGVSTKEKNGPSKKETLELLDEILKSGNLISSFDLVEFNPRNDINNKTLDIAEEIINKVIKNKQY